MPTLGVCLGLGEVVLGAPYCSRRAGTPRPFRDNQLRQRGLTQKPPTKRFAYLGRGMWAMEEQGRSWAGRSRLRARQRTDGSQSHGQGPA